jgi:putative transcriptional regulator
MLKWRLKQVMDDKGARTTDLASLIGVEVNTASRLRNRSTVPLLKPAKLDLICEWLGCQPGDLIEYTKGVEENEQRSPSVD